MGIWILVTGGRPKRVEVCNFEGENERGRRYSAGRCQLAIKFFGKRERQSDMSRKNEASRKDCLGKFEKLGMSPWVVIRNRKSQCLTIWTGEGRLMEGRWGRVARKKKSMDRLGH